jgi:hypothetical protein
LYLLLSQEQNLTKCPAQCTNDQPSWIMETSK